MVFIDVRIAEGMDEITILQAASLRNHHGEQSVRSNVERNAQKNVGTTLVKLAAKSSVGDIELKEDMTRRQSHLIHLTHVPRRNQQSTRIGIGLDIMNQILNLVDVAAIGTTPATPLTAVDRSQITILVSSLVPDCHLMVVQILNIRVPFEEPKEFVDNRAQVQLFGSQQRKTVIEMETHLITKRAYCACTRTVVFLHPLVKHMLQEI